MTAPPTILPNTGRPLGLEAVTAGDRATAGWRGLPWYAEHHLDLVAVDLNSAHEGADDVTLSLSVEVVQPGADAVREFAQPSHQELQTAFISCACAALSRSVRRRARRC